MLLTDVSFEEMEISALNDLNNFDYSKENLDKIKESYDLISILNSFFLSVTASAPFSSAAPARDRRAGEKARGRRRKGYLQSVFVP